MELSSLLYENDTELLSLLSKDKEEALRIIYKKYWEPLFVSAYNILKDKQACEDIVQDIFIQLWQRRNDLTIKSSLYAYLLTATRYQVFHAIKKSSLLPEIVNQPDEQTPEALLYVKDTEKEINRIVENLPGKCRDIYKLSREEHLSHKQIAQKLEISPKTVENQLTIALKRLRTALAHLSSLI